MAPEPDEASTNLSVVKNHEIPKLDNYDEIPDSSFWEKFPLVVETTVNIDAFAEEIESVKKFMTETEQKRAAKIIEELRFRANAFQKSELPPVNTVNAKKCFRKWGNSDRYNCVMD